MTLSIVKRCLYSPFLAQLVVTRRCNLACGYCSEFDQHSDHVPLEELKERIRKLKELGVFGIEFTGGEPLLHPDIIDIIQFAHELNFTKVMMISNAYLLNKEIIDQLNKVGLNEIQISIDGVEKTKTTSKVLSLLRGKLILLAEYATFKVIVSAVQGCTPTEEVLQVINFAKQHGFRPRTLLLHDDKGQLAIKNDALVRYIKIKKIIGGSLGRHNDYHFMLLTKGYAPFKCRAGSRYLYVSEFGLVHWCSQTRDSFSVPLEKYEFKDLQQQFFQDKRCNGQCTIGCVRKCSSFDQWRPQKANRKSF